jgi:hypothetical protein
MTMRTAENRMARNYDRWSLVADMFTLLGSYDIARTWREASREDAITTIGSVVKALHVTDELRLRFRSCLIAERYLRRAEYRMTLKHEEAA